VKKSANAKKIEDKQPKNLHWRPYGVV